MNKCDICGNEYGYINTIDKKKKPLNIPVRSFYDDVKDETVIVTKSVRYICGRCLDSLILNTKTKFGTKKIVEDGKNGITFKNLL